MSTAETNAPGKIVAESRVGLMQATLWSNATKNGTRHNVTLRRSYEKSPGEWKVIRISIPLRDLLAAAELLREMHHAAWQQIAAETTNPKSNSEGAVSK